MENGNAGRAKVRRLRYKDLKKMIYSCKFNKQVFFEQHFLIVSYL